VTARAGGPTVQEAMRALDKADTCTTCGKRKGAFVSNGNARRGKKGFRAEVIREDQKCTCDTPPADENSTENIMNRLHSMLQAAPDPYELKDEENGAGGGEGTAEHHGSLGDRKPSIGEPTPTSPAPLPEVSAAPAAPEAEPALNTTDVASQPVSADPPSLADRLRQLAQARARFTSANDVLQQRREELELELAGSVAEASVYRKQVEELEAEVRAAAEDHFKATGEKRPVAGIEVKEFTVVSYDAAKALEWARGAGVALSLNKGEFEKIAKTGSLPFVTISTEPRCTIAQKLTIEVDDAGEPRVLTGTAVEVAHA
jgi:hypothetical protein